jgi:hypothetical protein
MKFFCYFNFFTIFCLLWRHQLLTVKFSTINYYLIPIISRLITANTRKYDLNTRGKTLPVVNKNILRSEPHKCFRGWCETQWFLRGEILNFNEFSKFLFNTKILQKYENSQNILKLQQKSLKILKNHQTFNS